MLCDLEGWDGWEVGERFKREGTYVYPRLIYVDVWQKPTQHCKAISLQLIFFFFLIFKGITGGHKFELLLQSLGHFLQAGFLKLGLRL